MTQRRPAQVPIGLAISRTARLLGRAFDLRLAEAGGSGPIWSILMALIANVHGTQSELAERIGIRGPTLSHHLDAMERSGWITRSRKPDNRREHLVALTPAGRAEFHRLRTVAAAHDLRLRRGITDAQLEALRVVLAQLEANLRPSDA